MKSGLIFLVAVFLSAGVFAQQPPVRSDAPPPSQTGAKSPAKPKAPDPVANENQEKADAAAAQKQVIVDLLERSHAANEEILPDQRTNLLARQIAMVSRLNADTADKWAQELFQLGEDQGDDQKRGRMQVMAIQMVSQGDAEYGLKLLHQLRPVSETDASALNSASMISTAASSVFQGLARQKGESQLPRLRQEALRLAAETQYPYSAMAAVATELVRDQRRDEAKSTPEQTSVIEAVFDEAEANYERAVPTWSGNSDFGRMLQRVVYQLPREKVQHSLETLVRNVESTPRPSGSMSLKATGSQSFDSADPVEIALYEVAPLIRQFDPELMKQVVAEHPQMAQAQNTSSAWGGYPVRSGDDANQVTRLRAQNVAGWNPDRALAMSQSITDPNMRAATMGNVAEQVASNDPGRAMQLLDQAQTAAASSQDLKTELQLISSRAQVAEATNNSAMLREALRSGFEVGDQLLRQEQDANAGQVSWYLLGTLVQTGIKAEPDLTLAYINSFSLPYVRAELLLDAAQSIRFGSRSSRVRAMRAENMVN